MRKNSNFSRESSQRFFLLSKSWTRKNEKNKQGKKNMEIHQKKIFLSFSSVAHTHKLVSESNKKSFCHARKSKMRVGMEWVEKICEKENKKKSFQQQFQWFNKTAVLRVENLVIKFFLLLRNFFWGFISSYFAI